MSDKEDVFLIAGPGNHDNFLKAAFDSRNIAFSEAREWPRFSVRRGSTEKDNRLYDAVRYLVWGLKNRSAYLTNDNRHLDLLYPLFGRLVAKAAASAPLVWGWSQLSLESFRKSHGVKILEYPMVEIRMADRIQREAYRKHGLKTGYAVFTEKMMKRMEKEFEGADYINVLSSFARNSFLEKGIDEKKLVLTLPGIDIDNFKWRRGAAKAKGRFIVLLAGRMEFMKGINILIPALQKASIKNAELWIAGKRLPEAEQFIKNSNIKIRELGQVPRMNLPGVYQKAHCTVLPSIQESFGLVILESMASGTPVIASRNTGAPDVITNLKDGLLFESGDTDELISCLRKIAADADLREEMGKAARKKVEERFTLSDYNRRIGDLYDQVNRNK